MPEYRESRCCMCPNGAKENEQSTVCPPDPPFRHYSKPCRFVKTYIDKRGWLYKVRAGLGGDTFSGVYQKPGKSGWKSMKQLPWRDSLDAAQGDLNRYAGAKGWDEVDDNG